MSEKIEILSYLGFQYSNNDLQQDDEPFKPFSTHYDTLEVYGGFQFHLWELCSDCPGYLSTDVSYALTSGDYHNRGSSRNRVSLNIGAHQNFAKVMHLELKLGLSGNDNALNFGRGTRPEHEGSFNMQFQFLAGPEANLDSKGSLVLSLGVGYFYEMSVVGVDYHNQGLLFGIRLGFRPDNAENYNELEEQKKVSADLLEEKKFLEASITVLQDQHRVAEKEYERVLRINTLLQEGTSESPPIYFSSVFRFAGGQDSIPLKEVKDPGGNVLGLRNADLDLIIEWMKENRGVCFRLHGYSAALGSDKEANERSFHLASKVQEYLIENGNIPAKRLIIQGYANSDVGAFGSSVHGHQPAPQTENDSTIINCYQNDCVSFEYFKPKIDEGDIQIEDKPDL